MLKDNRHINESNCKDILKITKKLAEKANKVIKKIKGLKNVHASNN